MVASLMAIVLRITGRKLVSCSQCAVWEPAARQFGPNKLEEEIEAQRRTQGIENEFHHPLTVFEVESIK
jgi:hypothetical protein